MSVLLVEGKLETREKETRLTPIDCTKADDHLLIRIRLSRGKSVGPLYSFVYIKLVVGLQEKENSKPESWKTCLKTSRRKTLNIFEVCEGQAFLSSWFVRVESANGNNKAK